MSSYHYFKGGFIVVAKLKKIAAAIGLIVIGATAVTFLRYVFLDVFTDDNWEGVLKDEKYGKEVHVDNVEEITQKISCGYACIEMIGKSLGKDITEDSLYRENHKKITTAFGKGYENEMNKHFPGFKITRYCELRNSDFIRKLYEGLKNGYPVTIELAAQNKNEKPMKWTMHFCLVVACDLKQDRITVVNPYGYREYYTVEELIRATRYESYENMELGFRLGFLGGIFGKNTLYTMVKLDKKEYNSRK